jgi:hypothetical protein
MVRGFTSHLTTLAAPKVQTMVCNNNTSNMAETGESQISDLRKNHLDDHESIPHPRLDNIDLTKGTDNILLNNAKDINPIKVILNEQGSSPLKNRKKIALAICAWAKFILTQTRQTVPFAAALSRWRKSLSQKRRPGSTMILGKIPSRFRRVHANARYPRSIR